LVHSPQDLFVAEARKYDRRMSDAVSTLRDAVADVERRARELDPGVQQLEDWCEAVVAHVLRGASARGDEPAYTSETAWDGNSLDETGVDIAAALGMLDGPERAGINQTSGRHFAFIPGGGLFPAALGDLLADAANPYAGIRFAAPAAAELERSVLRWMADLVGYPASAGGDLTSGASVATLEAIVTAREAAPIRSADITRSVVYLTGQTHHCVEKGLRVAGLGECVLRHVQLDDRLRMVPAGLAAAVKSDRASGLNPWLVVATAGTVNVGSVDPLTTIADLADAQGLWLHVDAAYGGFFLLTAQGRNVLAGIERSRTAVMDPHKGLFLPFGSGALIVRDERQLADAHRYSATYLSDARADAGAFSASDLSIELSRPFRAPRLWLPLKLFGIAPFRAALEEKLLLARYFHARLSAIAGWEVGPEPDLSVVTYRYLPKKGDPNDFNRRLLDAVLRSGRAALSATEINGNYTLRLAVLHYRTHLDHVDELLELLLHEAAQLEAA
jgi:aromatic-L-amino-acid/L-tryptophan decarboxylase